MWSPFNSDFKTVLIFIPSITIYQMSMLRRKKRQFKTTFFFKKNIFRICSSILIWECEGSHLYFFLTELFWSILIGPSIIQMVIKGPEKVKLQFWVVLMVQKICLSFWSVLIDMEVQNVPGLFRVHGCSEPHIGFWWFISGQISPLDPSKVPGR